MAVNTSTSPKVQYGYADGTLDPTGNWQGFRQDDDGGGTWDLDQARTANTVNEITDITETAGLSWVTPSYNRAGNMTTMFLNNPASGVSARYDAWNRLAKLTTALGDISEYAYDGLGRRTVQKKYTSFVLSETRHLYDTQPSQWQVIEERLGTSPDSADPVSQAVWGLRYIDDCLLRDRDTDGNGTLNERLYAMQDANWNVTSLADTSGAIQERYAYTPYGVPLFLNASFTPQSSSSFAWNTLYCGYRYEPVTGLYHVRHRVLHPTLGTWVQRDPLGLMQGPSLYHYCNSQPVTNIDGSGLGFCDLSDFLDANPGADKLVNCICGLIGFADIFAFFPAMAAVAGALDCLCNGFASYRSCCGCRRFGIGIYTSRRRCSTRGGMDSQLRDWIPGSSPVIASLWRRM
jgi:RHS repeat-associated protein